MQTNEQPPPPGASSRPPVAGTRFDRFRNEVMAGGSVTEQRPGRRAVRRRVRRGDRRSRRSSGCSSGSAFDNIWMLRLRRRHPDLGLPPRARPLRDGPADRHEGHPVLPRLRAAPVELPPRRDRVRRAGAAARRLRADHRDEQHGRGAAGRRGAHLPPEELPAADARDHGRLADAHADRHRAAVRRLRDRAASSSTAPGAEVGDVAGRRPGPTAAGIQAGDVVVSHRRRSPSTDRTTSARPSGQLEPGDTVAVVVERDGEQLTIAVDARRQHRRPASSTFGTALLGVTSARAPTEWQELSLGEAATTSVTDLFPPAWESTKGVVKVLNPVNIFNHLSGSNDDLATRPTTLVGVTQVSDDVGETAGPRRRALPARRAQRVRRRVQHVPAAPARRRPRRDRHLRAGPRAARRAALLRRRRPS